VASLRLTPRESEHNKNRVALESVLSGHRLLLVVRPPPAAAAFIQSLGRDFGPSHVMGADRLHITLALFGDHAAFPRAQAERIMAAADSVAFPPFRVVFDFALATSSSVALRASEPLVRLAGLRDRLQHALAGAGAAIRMKQKFVPHVTLLHRRGPVFLQPIDMVSWQVREFFLVDSRLGAGVHQLLCRWPLD
jgi:RNA 2',3'-cyclic 3'-phosphodiesterase